MLQALTRVLKGALESNATLDINPEGSLRVLRALDAEELIVISGGEGGPDESPRGSWTV